MPLGNFSIDTMMNLHSPTRSISAFVNVSIFVLECGFDSRSRIWKKVDLFTMLVELDLLFRSEEYTPQPSEVVELMATFYRQIEGATVDAADIPGIYYKAALQATNDKVNRLRRGCIISGILRRQDHKRIMHALHGAGLA